jgi:hypothetical protein
MKSEQTYMKLDDPVTRPKFSKKMIDREFEPFKRMVNNYAKWNEYGGVDDPIEYENDIVACLLEPDLDGYYLAEFLKNKVWLEPNSELVEILDMASSVKYAIVNNAVKQWVKECCLTIPEDVVGKKVNAKQTGYVYEMHYITGISPETYEVTLSPDENRKGGYIVGFENVELI